MKKGFTLVELIVVITILAILWTIWFLAMQWYSSNARDSVRTTDLSNIEKSFELFMIKTWIYPNPSNSVSVTYSWWLAWKQWTFWKEPFVQLWNISKIPLDPLTTNEYTYSVTSNKTEYQLSAVYEWQISKNILILDKTYADWKLSWITKIVWTYNWTQLFVNTWSYDFTVFSPSIICSDLSDLDLQWIITNNRLALNWNSKLPYSYKNSSFKDEDIFLNIWNILISTWSLSDLKSNNQIWKDLRKEYLTNIQNVLSWSVLENNYYEVMSLDTSNPSNDNKVDALTLNIIKWKWTSWKNIVIASNKPTAFWPCLFWSWSGSIFWACSL